MRIKWACPRCGAEANTHGTKKGARKVCREEGDVDCAGLLCECDEENNLENHGEAFENPCPSATCHCCGWGGKLPRKPKGLAEWEKKAIDAGWQMPAARAEELGVNDKKG